MTLSTFCNIAPGEHSSAKRHRRTCQPTDEFEDEQDSSTCSADTAVTRVSLPRFVVPDERSVLDSESTDEVDTAASKESLHDGKPKYDFSFAPRYRPFHHQACLKTPIKTPESNQGRSTEREPASRNIHVLHSRYRALPAGSYSSPDNPFLSSPTLQREHRPNDKPIYPYQSHSYHSTRPLRRQWRKTRDNRLRRTSRWHNVGLGLLGRQLNNKLNPLHQRVKFRCSGCSQNFSTCRPLNRHPCLAKSPVGSVESLDSIKE
ncbi:hypothetical protein GGS26DRAFT_119413 [Hypomontagnella submonticulosa]|nr:hypothetical protein GGS26DRAFT_119413 [Hypomontagnella submonticulosa]